MTPEQRAILAHCLQIGFGELQLRVWRGDEDDHLTDLIDMFGAYFAVLRAKLGHDHVSINAWETYAMIRRRSAQMRDGSHAQPATAATNRKRGPMLCQDCNDGIKRYLDKPTGVWLHEIDVQGGRGVCADQCYVNHSASTSCVLATKGCVAEHPLMAVKLGAPEGTFDRSACPHPELTLIRNEESRKISLVQCEDCGEFVAYPGEIWREDLREAGRRFLELRGITE
jgi:hypothetical protein